MILGIVGAEEAKFTTTGRTSARYFIDAAIDRYGADYVSSGRCHLGGVDVWAEEIAKKRGRWHIEYIYPANVHTWDGDGGYMQRNIRIARASDVVVCIAVDRLSDEFVRAGGVDYGPCYHCLKPARRRAFPYVEHTKSGGCWTMWYAREIGKQGELIVVEN